MRSASLSQRVVAGCGGASVDDPSLPPPPPPASTLLRSYSLKNPAAASKSSGGKNFVRKCKSMAKEQKAKLYIVRRCISMLVRREKHSDGDGEEDDDGYSI